MSVLCTSVHPCYHFYVQVSVKLDETRKFFTMYNTLDRKKQYIAKQESLIGSMEANFALSMKVCFCLPVCRNRWRVSCIVSVILQSKAGKAAFLEQCAGIVASVEDGLAKQVQAADAKKAVRDARAADLQKLVDGQRDYYRAIKSMQELAERNEELSLLLTRLSEPATL
jgi:hypothetical protein